MTAVTSLEIESHTGAASLKAEADGTLTNMRMFVAEELMRVGEAVADTMNMTVLKDPRTVMIVASERGVSETEEGGMTRSLGGAIRRGGMIGRNSSVGLIPPVAQGFKQQDARFWSG